MKYTAILLTTGTLLFGCTKRTEIEPAEVSATDQAELVAAVYSTGIRTNGLSFYYAESFTRGRDRWLHVQFTDASQSNPALRPVYDFVQTSDGWKVLDTQDQ